MNLIEKIKSRLHHFYGRHVRRDPFLIEIDRWFSDKGDKTKRLDYALDHNSTVFDVGGYLGDFAADIHEKFGCSVYIFEPVPEFHQKCVERFRSNPKISCFNYGLSDADAHLNINMADNASSFDVSHGNAEVQRVEVRSASKCIKDLGVDHIDLLKINIEGGEFDLLPHLIDSGDIRRIKHVQVQFHNFIANAESRRDQIRGQLAQTHVEAWNYKFVWESWTRKADVLI